MLVKKLQLVIKRIMLSAIVLTLLALLLIQCNVIWLPPKKYVPKNHVSLQPPIMSLNEYTVSGLINTHARPYIFLLESGKTAGAALVFGAEHTFDPAHQQFVAMKESWDKFDPSVSMVEGNLDLLLKWFFDPVKASGEGGYVQKMAKRKRIKTYSWEPGKKAEVNYCLTKFDAKNVALFYALRKQHNKWADLSQAEQDKKMKAAISNSPVKATINSVAEVDSIWQQVCPAELSWRKYKHPQNGWPAGILSEIAEASNLVRDENMCQSIIELVNKGERVFISMGASHAPRIERTLRNMIQ